MILYHDNECETRASHCYSFIRPHRIDGSFEFDGVIALRHSSIPDSSYVYGLIEVLWGNPFIGFELWHEIRFSSGPLK